jgi:D-3-phosphoglycerate dehydrogenase
VTLPIGVSRDFLGPAGNNVWGDIGLDRLTQQHVPWEYLPENVPVLRPQDIDGRTAVIFASPGITAATFVGVRQPPAILARFGVGYDSVDLATCTDHDVAVTITPDGARRPVATAALTMMLAGLHNLAIKDRLVRLGRWDQRSSWMGRGLTGRTVGIIGFGGTATDLVTLLAPFQVTVLAYDPYCAPERAAAQQVDLVDLYELAHRADILVVMAALTDETHHLVDSALIEKMKASVLVVNVARGPIIDEQALTAALQVGRIAGAALDVFEQEPPDPKSPLLQLDSVVLSPHSIAWTDEMSTGNGASAVQAVLDVLGGQQPTFVVNRDVIEKDGFQRKLARLGAR